LIKAAVDKDAVDDDLKTLDDILPRAKKTWIEQDICVLLLYN